ncbi:MAG: hypothetical protein M5U01_03475 [Ardenticatenaceae bacterium]|nr:hypothetical protein [Ardenticatenaceae bacterium]HBY94650.1 hypothetical protein [Chloroflexota bacterium]
MADRESTYSTPRWVKVLGIIVLVVALLVVVVLVTGVGGPHGPGRHIPSGETPPSSVIAGHLPSRTGLGGYTLPIEHRV